VLLVWPLQAIQHRNLRHTEDGLWQAICPCLSHPIADQCLPLVIISHITVIVSAKPSLSKVTEQSNWACFSICPTLNKAFYGSLVSPALFHVQV